jgi:tetratricopeptide (TPR) repeat protein
MGRQSDWRSARWLAALCVLGSVQHVRVAAASPAEALAYCHRSEKVAPEQRVKILALGIAAAEAAIADDDDDARAHFALFCNLGKRLRHSGFGWRTLSDVRRLRRAIDRSLELDADNADALMAKAALLERLPRLLGGDRDQAEALLRRALHLRPDNVTAHLLLAGLLQERGEIGPAERQVRRALVLLRAETDESARVEAQQLLDEWCARAERPNVPC